MSAQVNLQLTKQEFDIIVEALTNMPWKIVHPVIVTLDKQIKEVDSAQETKPT